MDKLATWARWVAEHPATWPLLLALVAFLFKKLEKTPRGKAFVDFLHSLGIDPPKLIDALRRLATGQPPAPPPPSSSTPQAPTTPTIETKGTNINRVMRGVLAAGALLWILTSVHVSVGCAPSSGPGPKSPEPLIRAQARALVLGVAKGVKVGDLLCSETADHLAYDQGVALLKSCAAAYNVARAALMAAEKAIDAWDAGAEKRWACAMRRAFDGIDQLQGVLTNYAKTPPELEDGLKLASSVLSFVPDNCAADLTP